LLAQNGPEMGELTWKAMIAPQSSCFYFVSQAKAISKRLDSFCYRKMVQRWESLKGKPYREAIQVFLYPLSLSASTRFRV